MTAMIMRKISAHALFALFALICLIGAACSQDHWVQIVLKDWPAEFHQFHVFAFHSLDGEMTTSEFDARDVLDGEFKFSVPRAKGSLSISVAEIDKGGCKTKYAVLEGIQLDELAIGQSFKLPSPRSLEPKRCNCDKGWCKELISLDLSMASEKFTALTGAPGLASSPASKQVWVGSDKGSIFRFDYHQQSWEQLKSDGVAKEVLSLWATNEGRLWAISRGEIYHVSRGGTDITLHDTKEKTMPVDPPSFQALNPSLKKITGMYTGDEIFYIAGQVKTSNTGMVLIRDGNQSWSNNVSSLGLGRASYLNDIWVQHDNNEIWAVGSQGVIAIRMGPYNWEWGPRNLPELNAVWGVNTGERWVAGNDGCLYSSDSKNRLFTKQDSGTEKHLRALWGSDNKHVWAVGADGTILFYNGDKWRKISSKAAAEHLNAIWGFDANNVWIAGDRGTVLVIDPTVLLLP